MRNVLYIQNTGQELCYKLSRLTPLWQLVETHAKQRLEKPLIEPRKVVLRLDSRLLNLSKTPRYYDLMDLDKIGESACLHQQIKSVRTHGKIAWFAAIDLEVNYEELYMSLMSEFDVTKKRMNNSMEAAREAKRAALKAYQQLESKTKTLESDNELRKSRIVDLQAGLSTLQQYKESLRSAEASKTKLEGMLNSERSEKRQLERSLEVQRVQHQNARIRAQEATQRHQDALGEIQNLIEEGKKHRHIHREVTREALSNNNVYGLICELYNNTQY